jgi:hypothetical protein
MASPADRLRVLLSQLGVGMPSLPASPLHVRASIPAIQPIEDEPQFRQWYARMADQHGLDPNPDSPTQQYDYRAAFRAKATPDTSGHWPSAFKKAGHPNMVVGGFNVQTGARVPGTRQATEAELIELGWDPETAAWLSGLGR